MKAYDAVVNLWRHLCIDSVESLDRSLENFRILFAYHSGRMENEEITYHDTREIFENGKVLNFTGNPRSILEQQNQRLCYEYLKEKIVAREPVSLTLIKEVHRILTGGTYDEARYIRQGERPGEFKKNDYITGIHEVGSPPGRVGEDLRDLITEINEYHGREILKSAAYFHVRFEYIHPFADGNGRVGRTLLNYYLMIHDHPPLIIYDEDKDRYYRALEEYDAREEILPMYEFLTQQTEKTWKTVLDRSAADPAPKRKKPDDLR